MDVPGALIVLRGNSGSGKSTVARLVQERLPEGRCLVVSQDHVRRDMLRESDLPGAGNIELLEVLAGWGLGRGLLVVVEGILNADRYQRALGRLQEASRTALFFAWDLPLEETVRRHGERAKAVEFSESEMRNWYHGWQPLDFVQEFRLDRHIGAESAATEILHRLGAKLAQ